LSLVFEDFGVYIILFLRFVDWSGILLFRNKFRVVARRSFLQ